ncbi:MAG: hypothetical protein O3A63_01410 [Proteobacteria bacterium]|nr:hypothetical protein [Pseudomonadota bacterium]
MNRRQVLQTLSAAATLGFALPVRAQAGPIGSRLGLQLFTLRKAMAADLPGTLSTVASIGYRELEFAGYFDQKPVELKKRLDDLGLSAPSTHLPRQGRYRFRPLAERVADDRDGALLCRARPSGRSV